VELIFRESVQSNHAPPLPKKLPPPLPIKSKNNSNNNNNNNSKSSGSGSEVLHNRINMIYIVKKLNQFLKRRPAIESLKKKGIYKG
jgi:hypothetical protein